MSKIQDLAATTYPVDLDVWILDGQNHTLSSCDKLQRSVLFPPEASFSEMFRVARTAMVHDFHQVKVDAALLLSPLQQSPFTKNGVEGKLTPLAFWDSSTNVFGGFNDYARLKYDSFISVILADCLDLPNKDATGAAVGPTHSLNVTLGKFLLDRFPTGLKNADLFAPPFKVFA